jgi:hypothetical protein
MLRGVVDIDVKMTLLRTFLLTGGQVWTVTGDVPWEAGRHGGGMGLPWSSWVKKRVGGNDNVNSSLNMKDTTTGTRMGCRGALTTAVRCSSVMPRLPTADSRSDSL